MYIQIYNLKRCFECKCKKICVKTTDLLRMIFCCAEFSSIHESLWGKNPSLSYCQSTGYHSYMSHNNNAFCRPCFSSFMAPRHSSSTLRSLRATLLKIARWRSPIQKSFNPHKPKLNSAPQQLEDKPHVKGECSSDDETLIDYLLASHNHGVSFTELVWLHFISN